MTISDKIEKAKFRRSQALMSKTNVLWARDGYPTLDIESSVEVDNFNCRQLFGLSGNENIDYSHVGAEGLIRCYYHISYLLKGTTRDNIIRNNNSTLPNYCTCKNANIEQASNLIISGDQKKSGFYNDNGKFDTTKSAFRSNKESTTDDKDDTALTGMLRSLAELIGERSLLGKKDITGDPLISELMNVDQILGRRNSDLYPASGYSSNYSFGDGVYDTEAQSVVVDENYSGTPNYWHPSYSNAINIILSKINEIVSYINLTKITDTTYFINPKIIPGYTTSWSIQNTWINSLNQITTNINTFLTLLNSNYPFNGNINRTNPSKKIEIDSALDTLKTQMTNAVTNVIAIHDQINPSGSSIVNLGSGFFGNPDDNGATLWGARAQWIKSILDSNDGSRIALKGINSVIATMTASVTRAEEEYILIGVSKENVSWASSPAWIGGIATPDILGIEYHQTIDKDEESESYLELINDGYIVSWTGTAHATGYDVWRSLDWDGITGNWVKLLSASNTFSVQDVNPNNGQVYNFYTDLSINPNSIKPFYKVITYDTGGSGDYARIPAISEMSSPKNIDNFDGSSSGNTNNGVTYPASGGTGTEGTPPSENSMVNPTYGSVTWREPVLNYALLPLAGNRNCDVRLVLSEKSMYFWDGSTKEWVELAGSESGGGNGSSWKEPVEVLSFLPTINNTDGDIRLVLSEGKLYRWDSENGIWAKVESDAVVSLNHSDLIDMPENGEFNADHDSRYYTHEEIDSRVVELTQQLDVLKYLIPENSAPLSADLTLVGRTYQSGYLSHGYPDQQRFETLSAEQYFNKIIKGGSITLKSSLPDKEFNNADKGILELVVNGMVIDTFDLAGSFDEEKRTGNQTYTPKKGSNQKITVTYVGIYLNYSLYQRGSYEINLDSSVLVAGENSIKLRHVYDTATDSTPTLVLFYDPCQDVPSFTNFDIRQNKIISSKYLSGLRYYSINDTLNISFKALKLFNNTYVLPNQVTIDSTQLAIPSYSISYSSAGSTYEDFGQPFINAIVVSDEAKTISLANIITSTPSIKAVGRNLKESSEFNYSEKILINTYSPKSTDKNEYFVDETYRLPIESYDSTLSSYKNLWKSIDLIGSSDLQVFSGSLIYPRDNFSINCLPIQSANYYGLSGVRSYIRAFYDTNPHTNGTLYIKGYNIATCPYIKVEIKLPGQTGWLNLSVLYNAATYNGYDADGCLLSQNNNYYQYTTGNFSTADSGYKMLVKITMTASNYVPIEELSVDW